MEKQEEIFNERIIKNDENGFEVHFKPQKLGAYIALAIAFCLMIIDFVLFRGVFMYGGFGFLFRLSLHSLGFIALNLGILYTLYLAVYTMFSDYIVKLDKEKLSKFSAPIPRLYGNKSILRKDIESYHIEKSTSTSRASQLNYTRITQTYHNLRIKLYSGKEFTFFYSLSKNETFLIKRLLNKHIKFKIPISDF